MLPLFVFDRQILEIAGSPNRARFLVDAVADLRENLRARGGDLWVRHGDRVAEAVSLAESSGVRRVHVTRDGSRTFERTVSALRSSGLEVVIHPGISVVEPGAIAPEGKHAYEVFTPYLNAWLDAPRRSVAETPETVTFPSVGESPGEIPGPDDLARGEASPGLPDGGESAGRRLADSWFEDGVSSYAERRDRLDSGTSRLSPYLHLGCLSTLELVEESPEDDGGREFVRQLCWRDFFLQVLAVTPRYATEDYRPRDQPWNHDPDALNAWKEGRTGVPIVDAGMRQLSREGWIPNRIRLIVASFLTRDLGIHWTEGAAHFATLLVDGDLASNAGNWQWVAGTGNSRGRGNPMNVVRQARRFDGEGDYVRRWVPELAALDARQIHEPWKLPRAVLDELGYPLVEIGSRSLLGTRTGRRA